MSESRVSSRYAKSLLDLAIEQKSVEAVNKDISVFLEFCKASPELVKLLRNPVVASDKKLSILRQIFKEHIGKLTMLFFDIILKKNREYYMVEIAREFHNQYNRHSGIMTASVTTATELNPSIKESIRKSLEEQTKKRIELSSEVDPSVIGGFVIRMEDKLFDASIAGKLANIKKQLINSY